ncbi:MAG: ATP-dependent helicase [Candidatus Aegiribacteria sp.]|nr:ATP-dependent helicase [Candidatus Aegiribacteria sp.]
MDINTKQKKAVFELCGNTLITASPGSGKTRTLVARGIHRLENLPKFKSLALITYTNAAADEIASRLITEKNCFIGTIHSFCLEFILRPFSWKCNWTRPHVISYEQKQVFFEENDDINLESSLQNKFDELNKIRKRIDGSLDTSVDWNHPYELGDIAERYYEYQSSINAIDFNEILYRSYILVRDFKFIPISLSSMFYEILVDEFQDTNIYQYEILKLINSFGNCTFFFVGDEKQKIFSFAGAIEDSFERAKVDFNAQQLDLTEVYRSTNNIVRAYSKLFPDHPTIINSSDLANINIDIVTLQTDKKNHNSYIQRIVKHLVEKKGIGLSGIAILSTSWYAAFPVSQLLRANYRIVGLGALPHKGVSNSTMSLLRILSRYYVYPSIGAIRGIKRNFEAHMLINNIQYSDQERVICINNLIADFGRVTENINIAEGLLLIKSLFDKAFQVQDSTFGEIIDLISEEEKQAWSIGEYLKTLAGVDGITCNTIHKAKGLEFDAVILNGMNENRIPYQKLINRSNWTYAELTTADIENGRNLFYVAVSRAKKYLILLHNWKPSMFIGLLK